MRGSVKDKETKDLREFVIVLDKGSGAVMVLNKKEYQESPKDLYSAIDDSNSEYKAQLKAKEIKNMGVNRYIETVDRALMNA